MLASLTGMGTAAIAKTKLSQTSLKNRATKKGLIFGAAARQHLMASNPILAAHYAQECGILVPEWELKWETLRPTPDKFDFTQADWLAKFASSRKILFRGHTLVWHSALPKWFAETVNRENAERFLATHISTVAKRYAGKMHSWDVVNEAIEPWDKLPGNLRKTPWLNFLGEDYIELAFRVAAQADSKALLTYNDYGLEYDTPEHDARRSAVLKLLERLKSRKTPIHAFGMQSHLNANEKTLNQKKLRSFLADIASLGLKIMVTELDVLDKELPKDSKLRDTMVAKAYEEYLSVVLDEKAVIAVLTWGLSDRYTWLSEGNKRLDGSPLRPLPLDSNFRRKLAWNAVARAFDKAPKRSIRSRR